MIYFNNSATSYPKPGSVIEMVDKVIREAPCDSRRSSCRTSLSDLASNCRKSLARLFNVKNHDNMVFTSGATESLNQALSGIAFKRGDHILSTVNEHNSVIRPLKRIEAETGARVSFVKCDGEGRIDVRYFLSAITGDTKLIAVNHASNVTGALQNIEKICANARKLNIKTLIDASQSAGDAQIDIEKIDPDYFAFTGHKSLYSIQGIGGLYIKDPVSLRALKVGGTGVKSDMLFQPEYMPVKFEAGTQNVTGIASLLAGTDYILNEGIEKIRKYKKELTGLALEKLMEMPEIEIIGPRSLLDRLAIISFKIKSISNSDVCYALEKSFEIIIRCGLHCAPLIHEALSCYPEGTLRISFSYFNKAEEIEKFVSCLKKICMELKA